MPSSGGHRIIHDGQDITTFFVYFSIGLIGLGQLLPTKLQHLGVDINLPPTLVHPPLCRITAHASAR